MNLAICKTALSALVFTLVLGTVLGTPAREAQAQTLYDRLGGKGAVLAVVDKFVNNLGADDRINHRFANTDIGALRHLLFEQVCAATGGPCTYTGRDMVMSHKGMNISEDEFTWTGQHLAAALDTYKVPDQEKNELLGAIGSMKGDIVGK